MKLCKCNNCETVMFDENPTETGFDFDDKDVANYKPEHMAYLEDETGYFWGCPNCETDGYLTDLVSRDELIES